MTTTDLVPVFAGTLAGQPTPLCNARDLHAALGVGRDFSTWIKQRIAEYGFSEGEDFVFDSTKRGNQSGRGGDRRSLDYHLTLDMAKELAMVENNDAGRRIRRYFIALEKQARQAALPAPVDSAMDREKRSRMNRRAWELARRAYDTYREQMRDCHLIERGLVEIERWLPPQLAEEIVRNGETIAEACEAFAHGMRRRSQEIAAMAGIGLDLAG
ncbi:MAG: antA/AntB antirepressor family protein [Gemmatimonadales bacterium]|nr:antA/AntB antirepressor family protein [Gemmatimonadales bacterium]